MPKHLLYILATLLVLSCSTPKKQETSKKPSTKLVISNCVSELNKNAIIRWGWVYKEKNTEKAYKLDTYGDIEKEEEQKIVLRKGGVAKTDETKSKFIETVSRETYCDIFVSLQKEFIRTPSLFVPADTMVFIQLINPDAGTNLRALWNPKYEAVGSEEYRAVWKKLEKALPSNPAYLHKK